MSSSSIGARCFPELEGSSSPFYRISSWYEGNQPVTRYDWNPQSRFAKRAETMVKALLDGHKDLIGLFSPEALHAQFLKDRCFVIIRKNTVAFSAYESGKVPVRYQDYFSEGLPVHPTTCPRGHHFELESARRLVNRMGSACPVSPDHSIGELVEDQTLRQELLQAVPELDEPLFQPKSMVSTVVDLVQEVWRSAKRWIEGLWLKAQQLFSRPPAPVDPFYADNGVGYVLWTPLEIFKVVRSIFPDAAATVDVDAAGSVSLTVTIPDVRNPIVFHSVVMTDSFREDLEELDEKVLCARGAVIDDQIDVQSISEPEQKLRDWQGFRRRRYEIENLNPCQKVIARYLTTSSPEALDTLRFLGLAPEQVDRGDVSEGDLNYFLLAMDLFEPLSPFERERAEAMLEKTFPLIAKKAFIERVRQEFKTLKNSKENVWLSPLVTGSRS